jgi:hypothetical protein
MNRKSAIATAGGLVASFAAGVAAVTFNWGLGSPAAATTPVATPSPAKTHKTKPIIRHRTITVHKKAPAPKPVSYSGGGSYSSYNSGSSSSGSAPRSRTITLASNPINGVSTPPVTHSGGSSAGGGGGGGGGDDDGGEGGDD